LYNIKDGKKGKEIQGRAKITEMSISELQLFATFPSSGDYSIEIYGRLKDENMNRNRHILSLKISNYGNGDNDFKL